MDGLFPSGQHQFMGSLEAELRFLFFGEEKHIYYRFVLTTDYIPAERIWNMHVPFLLQEQIWLCQTASRAFKSQINYLNFLEKMAYRFVA